MGFGESLAMQNPFWAKRKSDQYWGSSPWGYEYFTPSGSDRWQKGGGVNLFRQVFGRLSPEEQQKWFETHKQGKMINLSSNPSEWWSTVTDLLKIPETFTPLANMSEEEPALHPMHSEPQWGLPTSIAGTIPQMNQWGTWENQPGGYQFPGIQDWGLLGQQATPFGGWQDQGGMMHYNAPGWGQGMNPLWAKETYDPNVGGGNWLTLADLLGGTWNIPKKKKPLAGMADDESLL